MTSLPAPLTDNFDPARKDISVVQSRTMIVLAITQVIGTVGVGVAPSIGVLLAGQVTDNEAWAGLARTSSTLGAALLGLPLGTLAARGGRRIALASGWWIAAGGAALLVAAAQWNLVVPLFGGLLMIGAGSAVSLQTRFAATDLATPGHKARSLALIVWVGTIGMVLGPNLGVPGGFLSSSTGLTVFAAAFLLAATCLALAGLLVFLLLRPDPLLLIQQHAAIGTQSLAGSAVRGPKMGVRRRRTQSSVLQLFSHVRQSPAARLAVVAILTAQIVMVSIMTMTPVHIAHHGGSVTVIGVTISLHIAGMYALAPVVGILADRLGHRSTIWIGIAILLASLLIGAIWPEDMGWMVASLILLGIGWSFVNVAGSALFSDAIPVNARAASQGGVDALSNLCGATAAFAAGPLLAVSSFATLAVVAIVTLVPLMAFLAISSKGSRRAHP